MWSENVLGTIGNTPLVRLNSLFRQFPATVLAKVEFFNPGASVKDRIGVAMVEAAERDGRLKPGGTIIEGTSGNTGAGLALAAIAKGYNCIFTTTDKQSQEKVDVLRALGAEVIVCPTAVAPDDPRSYYSVARRLEKETPNSVYLNQYDNPANAEAHYQTTGPELWEQTSGAITHFFAGAGTGGTISGTSKYLKEHSDSVKVVGVDPFGSVYHKYFFTGEFDQKEIYPYVTEGVGEDILAKNMDFGKVDDYVRVTDRDAMLYTRRLAREEGLFCGQSCGMVVAGAIQWMQANAADLGPDSIVVILLPDSGFRYLSKTYNDAWMRNHGYLSTRPEWTVAEIASARRGTPSVLAVGPDDSLGRAIELMGQGDVSQLPVIQGDDVVGSLSETLILNCLIKDPGARDNRVSQVMAGPIPVVPASLHLEHLSAYLEQEPGAVLLKSEDGGYQIITKSDLIRTLAAGKKPTEAVQA